MFPERIDILASLNLRKFFFGCIEYLEYFQIFLKDDGLFFSDSFYKTREIDSKK